MLRRPGPPWLSPRLLRTRPPPVVVEREALWHGVRPQERRPAVAAYAGAVVAPLAGAQLLLYVVRKQRGSCQVGVLFSERGQARGLGLKHPVVAPQRRLDEVGPAGLGLVLVGRGPGGAGDELLGRDAFAELGLKPRGGGGQSTGRGRGGRRAAVAIDGDDAVFFVAAAAAAKKGADVEAREQVPVRAEASVRCIPVAVDRRGRAGWRDKGKPCGLLRRILSR